MYGVVMAQLVSVEVCLVERKEKKDFHTTKKKLKSGTIREVIDHLAELLKEFSIHNHTNINQLHNFKQAKLNLKPNEVIISEDFSENYSLKHQNEIMSAHWSQEELSLFCATTHYLKSGKLTFQHYVLCSDDLTHNKNTIFFYNSYIINDLKSKGLAFDMVHYWSDGPSSQFKNQYNFTNLLLHEQDYGMPADWNFFATSHGKGENDGAGGDVKNAVWRKVLQNKVVVGDLETFVSVAKAKFPNFIIEGFKSEEISNAVDHLPDRYEKHSKRLKNTHKFHHVTIKDNKVVGFLLTKTCPCHQKKITNQNVEAKSTVEASTAEASTTEASTVEPIIPTVGQFYKVKYSFLDAKGGQVDRILPAMCSKTDIEEHLFTFLKQIRGKHYLLDEADQAWINENDICKTLPLPDLTRRGEYHWENEI